MAYDFDGYVFIREHFLVRFALPGSGRKKVATTVAQSFLATSRVADIASWVGIQ
jgi:hypothetical protein